jgi:hypothetical protein
MKSNKLKILLIITSILLAISISIIIFLYIFRPYNIILIDKDIENIDEVGVHPNINTSTVFMNPKDLKKIFKNNKYK